MSAPHQAYSRPYLDADAWIHALEGTEDGRQVLQPLLEAVDRGQMTLVVSAIMPVELLGGRSPNRAQDAEQQALEALSRPNVVEVPVGRAVVLLARQLRLEHSLDSMDALHLASAVRGNADVHFTYDEGVLRVGQVRETRISKPYWLGDVPMPGLGD